MIFISRKWFLSCVITCSDFYTLSNQINLFMVINIWGIIIYIYCMLVREIWKLIHPRVSYSLRAMPEGNMILVDEYIFIFPEPVCYQCFIIPNKIKKTHTCKILQASIFSVHWNVVSEYDAFRVPLTFSCQRTIALTGKPARGGIWFLFHGIWFLSCVITFSDLYPLSNQIDIFMVINIWGIIIQLRELDKHPGTNISSILL
jgi:hypothetical protein